MRSPPWAVASIWATVAGRSSTPACAAPDGDRGPDVVDAVLEAELVRREGGEADVEAAGVEVAGVGQRVGSRAEQHLAVGEHEGEAAGVDHGGGDRDVGRGRPGVVEPGRQGGHEVGALGEPGEQAVDAVDGELVLDQLDDVGERGAGVAGRARRRPRARPCRRARSRSGGGRRRPPRAARPRRPRWRRRWRGRRRATRCGARRPRRRGRRAARRSTGSRSVRPFGERQAPDRREVRPARAQQVEPVALGLLGGVLVGEDVGAGRAELEGADHAGGVSLHAGVVGGRHAVER